MLVDQGWADAFGTFACLNVMDAFDKGAEVIFRVIKQALASDDPVADITGEAHVRQLPDQLKRDPRVEQ